MSEQSRKYCKTFNSQVNPNATKLNDWTDRPNALINNSDTYAKSFFTQKKYIKSYKKTTKTDKKGKKTTVKTPVYAVKKVKPYTVTAHEFEANLPSTACVTQIRFVVRMRVSKTKNVSVKAPNGRFCIYGDAYKKKYDDTKAKTIKDGWNDGYFWSVTDSKKLTTKFQNYTYTMGKSDVAKGKFSIANINASIMGIDLVFNQAEWKHKNNGTLEIDIAWVRCEIDYEIPQYKISYADNLSQSLVAMTDIYDPFTNKLLYKKGSTAKFQQEIYTGNEFELDVTAKNTTCGKGGSQVLNVTIPYGTDLVQMTRCDGSWNNTPTSKADGSKVYKWTVNMDGAKTNKAHLILKPYKATTSTLTTGNATVGYKDYIYNTIWDIGEGYNQITVDFKDETHLNHLNCFYVNINGYSYDDTVDITIANNKSFTIQNVEILQGSDGVSLDSYANNVAHLTVPAVTDYTAQLKVCFYAHETGSNTLTITSSDYPNPVTQKYNVLSAYTYYISSNATNDVNKRYLASDEIVIENHRVVSETEPMAVVLDAKSKDGDDTMIISPCTIKMHYLEGLDYIGCVPLEQTHFNPVSTYKDTLIDSHYKNKRYMGKKLASDENITLNVRLHPQQVTTIQGLIDMDKPIPINANHKCFEGDALNHRGWAEIYGIKAEQTGNNPHWYKCDIDVKYLTHNLNTRFYIQKGVKIVDYPFSDLLDYTYMSGTSLSDDDYFDVETDGSYYYNDDDDVDENKRNMFTLDNSQKFVIKSHNSLASKTSIVFEWFNTFFSEIKENNVSRIIRLVDDVGNPVFSYVYSDYVIDDDSISCNVIGYRGDGTLTNDIDADIDLAKGVDILDSSEDDFGNYGEYYGSRVHFNLDGNILEVIDEGFNGKEVSLSNIELKEGTYKFEVEFKNNNNDNETNDVIVFTDFQVFDTVLQSDFDTKYQKMYVSPYPVSNKTLLFTREAEEGTIYYYEDDGGEFSYLIDPYYQYMNGTDLVSDTGISIFNLNYGFEIVYIQNGLVRLGFNRINGQLYLGKYDVTSHEYITTHRLQLEKYNDINVKSISDDKIEIQASDSIFSIWRGHPYIMIKHDGEDINIETLFSRVWAEKVGNDSATELPIFWDLMNNDNLLPSSMSANTLSVDGVEVNELSHSDRNSSSIEWGTVPTSSEAEVDTNLVFNIIGTTSNIRDEVDVETEESEGFWGSYTVTYTADDVPSSIYVDSEDEKAILNGDTVDLVARVVDYNGKGVANQTVNIYAEFEEIPSQCCNFYDSGIGSTGDGSFSYNSTFLNKSVDATGTLLECDSSSSESRVYSAINPVDSSYSSWSSPINVEMDIVASSSTIYVQLFKDTNTSISTTLSQLGLSDGGHLRISYDGSTAKYYVNGETTPTYTSNTSITGGFQVRFGVVTSATVKYKEFRIY